MMANSRELAINSLTQQAYRAALACHGDLGLDSEHYASHLLFVTKKHLGESRKQDSALAFITTLHTNDLYLTVACARPIDAAWERFTILYQAFIDKVARRACCTATAAQDIAENIPSHVFLDKASPSAAPTVNCSGFLLLRDGTRYRIDGGRVTWLRDRNGNLLNFVYGTNPNDLDSLGRVISITDSLNRQVTIQYRQSAPTYGLVDRINFKGFAGAPRTISIARYGNLSSFFRSASPAYSSQTLKQLFPELNGTQTIYDPTVVSAVYMPDGRSFQFRYNPYGEIEQVVLPTGGAIEYRMASGSGAYPIYADAGNYQIFRRVAERHVYLQANNAASLEGKTVYAATFSTPFDPRPWSTTVTVDSLDANNALLRRSKHHFERSGLAGLFQYEANFYPAADEGQETKTEEFDTNGTTLLRRTESTFEQRASIWWWPAFAAEQHLNVEDEPGLDKRLTLLRKTLEPDGANQVSKEEYDYDQYTNKVVSREYDFGTGSPGALVRRVEVGYLSTLGSNNYATDTGIHLRSLPTSERVYAGSSTNPTAETQYEYDNYNQSTSDVFHAALVGRSSISGLDGSFTTAYYTRGNVTKTTRAVAFDGSGNITSSISTYTQYDIAGNAVKVIDPRSTTSNIISTTFDFSDRFGEPNGDARGNTSPTPLGTQTSYAFPTLVTNALGHNVYTQYDYYLGNPVDAEDANQITSSGFYSDLLDRPTEVWRDVQSGVAYSKTRFVYDDANHTVTTETDQTTVGDLAQRSLIGYDGLGRTFRHATYEGNTGSADTWAIVETQFDALGRVKQVSNPFRDTDPLNAAAPSGIWTATSYDALSRVLTVTTPDSAVVTTSYDGPRVLVTDQGGKQRISKTDGLERLTDVWEIRSADAVTGTEPVTFPNYTDVAAGYRTKYSYDALDDLTQVTQQIGTTGTTQTRTFAYDGLKRLTSAANPESGTVSYTYDENSNLKSKLDARSITTTYDYDALNRVTSRTYSDTTPAVSYKYDAQTLPTGAPGTSDFDRGYSTGRLVSVTYGGTSAGTYTGHDKLGRTNVSVQQTDSTNYRLAYSYNLASAMTSEVYPSGRTVTNAYDLAGRLTSVDGHKPGESIKTYASSFSYAPHGAVSVMKFGNGKWEHTNFNSRLQPTQIGLGTSSTDSSLLKLDYGYGTTTNNGNVLTQTITAPGLLLNQCYGYDSLNRLSTAEERGGGTSCAGTQQWKQAFSYDRYGNRNFDLANTTANVLGPNPTISQTNNRFGTGQNYGYDSAGNLTSDPATNTNGIAYDAENRQTQYTKIGQATNFYHYDGDGRRVRKIDGSGTTVFVYNVGGQLIAEYHSDPVPPAAGGGGTSYLTTDHLGSTRVVTKADGTVKASYDYLPFGQELGSGTGGRTVGMGYSTADSTKQKFTQKERDIESGLDYFGARYYSSAQGRFTSPDEFTGGPDEFYDFADKSAVNPTLYADLSDPQSLNKYQYCYNNPLLYIDPNGHQGLREYARKIGDAAYQVGKDTVVGGVKGVYNLAVGVPNTINTVVDTVISPFTDFRFGQLPTAEPGTTGEKGAMLATDIIATVYAAKASAGGLARAEEAITGVVDSIPKRVANSDVVVRGGTQPMPPQGTTFSGAAGKTLQEAASGVRHNQVRTTTAGAVRAGGGKVRSRPERAYPGGPINKRHVNIKEGPGPTTFSDPVKNPVPKEKRP